MINLVKYFIAFILGAIFMAHNPKLISSVTELTDLARHQIVELTGKAGQEAKKQNEMAEEKKRQLKEHVE